MLITGNAIGKKTGNIYAFVSVSFSQEFIDYIKIKFDRDCEIDGNMLIIYPSKESGKYMQFRHTKEEVENDHLYIIQINDDKEINNIDIMTFGQLCHYYFVP